VALPLLPLLKTGKERKGRKPPVPIPSAICNELKGTGQRGGNASHLFLLLVKEGGGEFSLYLYFTWEMKRGGLLFFFHHHREREGEKGEEKRKKRRDLISSSSPSWHLQVKEKEGAGISEERKEGTFWHLTSNELRRGKGRREKGSGGSTFPSILLQCA